MQMETIRLDSVDSTNTWAKAHCKASLDKMICVLAEEQTAGRGRFNRSWHSPRGKNLYATLVFALSLPLHFSSLGQVMALSLAKVLLRLDLPPQVKWPNDILLGGKKVSGVLCEMQSHKNKTDVYLGIGVNLNLDAEDLKQIGQPATSLKLETNREWDKEVFFKKLLAQFTSDLEWFKQKGFEPFHAQFENLMAFKGQLVRCFDGKKEWVGICHSITFDGQLNLCLPDHSIHTISAGDIK